MTGASEGGTWRSVADTGLDAARQEYDIDWQRRVLGMLTRLLGHCAGQRLPVISWTITCGAPQLLARCDGYPQDQRQADFAAWTAALTVLAGPPDHAHQGAFRSGQARAYAIWERYDGVRVNLGAEWDTPDPAPDQATEETEEAGR